MTATSSNEQELGRGAPLAVQTDGLGRKGERRKTAETDLMGGLVRDPDDRVPSLERRPVS